MKHLSNKQWLKTQLKVNQQLFELGLISHVEKIAKDIQARYIYTTQKKDSE